MKIWTLIISLFFSQIAFSDDLQYSNEDNRELVSCDTYFTDRDPTARQIEVGKSSIIIYDSEKNEVLNGEASEVERQLSKMSIQGFAIIFNLKTWLPDIYEAGLTRVILDENNNSVIDKSSTYYARSASPYLLVGIRINSKDFLVARCHDPNGPRSVESKINIPSVANSRK